MERLFDLQGQVISSLTSENGALRLDARGEGILLTSHQREKFNNHSGQRIGVLVEVIRYSVTAGVALVFFPLNFCGKTTESTRGKKKKILSCCQEGGTRLKLHYAVKQQGHKVVEQAD